MFCGPHRCLLHVVLSCSFWSSSKTARQNLEQTAWVSEAARWMEILGFSNRLHFMTSLVPWLPTIQLLIVSDQKLDGGKAWV